MPDHGHHQRGISECTRRFYSLFSGWICSLTFRQLAGLVKPSFSSSHSNLPKERRSPSSACFNNMESDLIDLSSGSDFGLSSDDDEPQEVPPQPERSSSSYRRLPPSLGRRDEGFHKQPSRPSSSRGPHSHNVHHAQVESIPGTSPPQPEGSSSSYRRLPPSLGRRDEGFQKQPSRPSSSRGPHSHSVHHSHAEPTPSTSYGLGNQSLNPRRGMGNGSGSQSRMNDEQTYWNSSFNARDDQHLNKRLLPPSIQTSGTRASNQSNPWDNLSRNRGYLGRGSDSDAHLFDSNHPRILPHSVLRGKPGSSRDHTSAADPFQTMGFGEERVLGDERLIYQAALQDLSQPRVELDIPQGLLTVPLLRHQKIALAWMVDKESRTMHCLGGILADDQGLGKTISTIALMLKQWPAQMKSQTEKQENHYTEAYNLDDDDDDDGNMGEKMEDPNVAKCKSEELSNKEPELYNLDDDDDSGSVDSETFQKKEKGDSSKSNSGASSSRHKVQGNRPSAGTLIVCPATVLRQWARELSEKVAKKANISVLVYHGGTRTKDPVKLAKHDVVLTTYAIVTNEVPKQALVDEDDAEQKPGEKYGLSADFTVSKKRKHASTTKKKGKKGKKSADSSFNSQAGPLARVNWFRVVLDEAQTIKNHRTQTARACCGLRAKRRWCLSGTPIQNSVDEMYSYFRFLRHHPYSSYKSFFDGIKNPISRDPNIGYKKLQAVLRTLLLRRTKETLLDGEPIISLPSKTINMKTVNFTAEERAFYAQLEAESRSQFKAYAAAGTVNQNYANILLMILRLRQACDHPLLVKGFNSGSARKTNLEKAKKLPSQVLMGLLDRLETASAICLLCSDPAEDAVVTICGHVFCYQCVADYITGDDNVCPARKCKEQLSDDVIFSEATLTSCVCGDVDSNYSNDSGSSKTPSILSNEYSSSKIKAALEILLAHSKLNSSCIELDELVSMTTENSMSAHVRTEKMEDSSSQGPIKTIVFSQWTRMLDLFEYALNQYNIQYRRLDGSMTLGARDRAVREFNTTPEVTCMLMSLKAGNLGLNMVAACHVILLDLWWNPTTEDQAIDRAHRIGQTRPVTVSRITIKDTVEDRILALQEEKRKMVASAFGEDHVAGSGARLTIDDLKYLFLGSRAM